MAIKGHRTVNNTDSVALQPQNLAIGTENLLTDHVIKIRLIIEIKLNRLFIILTLCR